MEETKTVTVLFALDIHISSDTWNTRSYMKTSEDLKSNDGQRFMKGMVRN